MTNEREARQIRECTICGEKVTMSNATEQWEERHRHGMGQPVSDNEVTNEYTPTTDEVREAYVGQENLRESNRGRLPDDVLFGSEFDRWLSANDAEVRATALEEAAQIAEGAYPLGSLVLGDAPAKIAVAIRAVQENPGKDNQ